MCHTKLAICLDDYEDEYIGINYKGDTALHKAMRNESFYAVTQLITQGASVDISNKKGKSFTFLQHLI